MASLLRPDDGPSSTLFDATARFAASTSASTPPSLSYGTGRREAPVAFDAREYRVVESIGCSFRHILSSLDSSIASIHRRSSTALNTSATRVLSDFHRIRGSALRCLLTALDLDRFARDKAKRHIALLYEDQRFAEAEEAKQGTTAFPSLLSLLHCHLEKNGVEEWDRWDRREVHSQLKQSMHPYLPISEATASSPSASSPSFPVSSLLPSLLDAGNGRWQVRLDEGGEEKERGRRRRRAKRMDSSPVDTSTEGPSPTEPSLRTKEGTRREVQRVKQRRQPSQQQRSAAADEEVQAILHQHSDSSSPSFDQRPDSKEEQQREEEREEAPTSQVLLRLPRSLFTHSPRPSSVSPPMDVDFAVEDAAPSPSPVMSPVVEAASPLMNGRAESSTSKSPSPAPAPVHSAAPPSPVPTFISTITSPLPNDVAPAPSSSEKKRATRPTDTPTTRILTPPVVPPSATAPTSQPSLALLPKLTPSTRPTRERKVAPRYGDEPEDGRVASSATRIPSKPRKQLNGRTHPTPSHTASPDKRKEAVNGREVSEEDEHADEDVHEIEQYLAYRYRAYPPFHPKASEHYRMYLVKWKGWAELWWIMEEDLVSVDPQLLQGLPEWDDWRTQNPGVQVRAEEKWEDPKVSQQRKRPPQRRHFRGPKRRRTR